MHHGDASQYENFTEQPKVFIVSADKYYMKEAIMKIINGWTKQQVIDAVDRHVPEEGAWDNLDSACTYEDHNGKRCAVGALVPDMVFDMIRDYQGEITTYYEEIYDRELFDHLPFSLNDLYRLQKIHDDLSSKNRYIETPIDVKSFLIDFIKDTATE